MMAINLASTILLVTDAVHRCRPYYIPTLGKNKIDPATDRITTILAMELLAMKDLKIKIPKRVMLNLKKKFKKLLLLFSNPKIAF